MANKPSAIITGAASGIGKATAIAFSKAGYALTLVDIAEESLNRVGDEIKSQVQEAYLLTIPGDLGDRHFLADVVNRSYDKWKNIHVLINNAAWRTIETMRNISPENWNKTLDVCLTAPAFLSKQAAGYMEKDQIPGVIINISSIMAQRAGGFSPAYIAAKGGLTSLTHELAALYGPSGIRVVCVSPGNVHTLINQDLKDDKGRNIQGTLVEHVENLTPLKRSAEPFELAETLLWLASEKASFITGTTITVDGGFSTNFNSYQIKNTQFPKEF